MAFAACSTWIARPERITVIADYPDRRLAQVERLIAAQKSSAFRLPATPTARYMPTFNHPLAATGLPPFAGRSHPSRREPEPAHTGEWKRQWGITVPGGLSNWMVSDHHAECDSRPIAVMNSERNPRRRLPVRPPIVGIVADSTIVGSVETGTKLSPRNCGLTSDPTGGFFEYQVAGFLLDYQAEHPAYIHPQFDYIACSASTSPIDPRPGARTCTPCSTTAGASTLILPAGDRPPSAPPVEELWRASDRRRMIFQR